MASTLTLTELPIEVVARIAESLSLQDVRNFRQACRKAESDSFDHFARCGYSKKTISVTDCGIPSTSAIYGSKQLARSTETLRLHFPAWVVREFWRPPSTETYWQTRLDQLAVPQAKPDPCELFIDLPRLKTLQLCGLDSATMHAHLSPRELTKSIGLSGASITSLSLRCLKLTSEDQINLLKAVGPQLKTLFMKEIVLTSGGCAEILLTAQSYALEQVQLHDMHILSGLNGATSIGNQFAPFGTGGGVSTTWFKGKDGLGHYWMRGAKMGMIGREAVEAGLELLIKTLEAL